MGGMGSGNHNFRTNKKSTVEDCLSLDANRWMRESILKAGKLVSGSWRWTYHSGSGFTVHYTADTRNLDGPFVRLSYSWVWQATQKQDSVSYQVRLTTTTPRFGGLRWWFICPLVVNGQSCQRRVGKLHLPPQASYFGCRKCHNLTYTSCQESHKYDSLYRFMARNTNMDFDFVKEVMSSWGKDR